VKLYSFLVLLVVSATEVTADEYTKMAKVTCAPEIGLFEITSTGVANISDNYDPGYDIGMVFEDISKKYGLYVGGNTKHLCTVDGMNIEAHLVYRQPSASGRCGGNPGAMLEVFVDGEKVISGMPFQEDCYSTSAYSLKVDKYNVWVCGGTGVPSHCIWGEVKDRNRGRRPLTLKRVSDAVHK
jgi:hypothetical protein